MLLEILGHILGYILGLFTALISFLRGSRMFHPRGLLYQAVVDSETLYSCAMVRLSSAWWKQKEWPDVLGIAIRFSIDPPFRVTPSKEDQDLLFATIPEPWLTPISPLLTNHQDFMKNIYYAVSPFTHEGKIKKFRLTPLKRTNHSGTRIERLQETILEGGAIFIMEEMATGEREWSKTGTLQLTRSLNLDQEELRFNPFQNGLGIRPQGFVHYLRIGTYRMSQWARHLRSPPNDDERT